MKNFKNKTYKEKLNMLNLESLKERRKRMCLNFALKCLKNRKVENMFPENRKTHEMKTRKFEKYMVEPAKTERKKKSPIIYMQKLLNSYENEYKNTN